MNFNRHVRKGKYSYLILFLAHQDEITRRECISLIHDVIKMVLFSYFIYFSPR